MGSPAGPGEIRPFLSRLFLDPELVSFPGGTLFRPMWAGLLAWLRAPSVRRRYQLLGGTSPLLEITLRQARALEVALSARGMTVPVEVCMRYSHPTADEALRRLLDRGAETIVGFPLYPQYSRATTGSSLRDLRQARQRGCPGLEYLEIEQWHDLLGYHRAVALRILASLKGGGSEDRTGLLFMAHSLPERLVRQGDPYVDQVGATVRGILAQLEEEAWGPIPWFLAYQGQVGPVRWVGPAVRAVLEVMRGQGLTRVLVVPVSFVSDHLETLYEIDLVVRRMALEMGVKHFERVPSLNDGEDFIQGLAGLLAARISGSGDDSSPPR
jgi:protoporphyrin/coproporphyrin ferrochelatase